VKSDVLVHIREAFGIRERTALYLMLGIIEIVGIGVLVAGRTGRLACWSACAGLCFPCSPSPRSFRWKRFSRSVTLAP
jgi:hypothetical protein